MSVLRTGRVGAKRLGAKQHCMSDSKCGFGVLVIDLYDDRVSAASQCHRGGNCTQ